jgi:hypothetical protein
MADQILEEARSAIRDLFENEGDSWLEELGAIEAPEATIDESDGSSYDGFISFTDGTVRVSAFVDPGYLSGTGNGTGSSKGDEWLTKMNDEAYDEAIKYFSENHPEVVEQYGEDKINYSDLYDLGEADLAEELSELESSYYDNMYIDYFIEVLLYAPENSHGSSRESYSATVNAVIDWAGDTNMGRSSRSDFRDADIEFSSVEDLMSQLESVIPQVISEF